MDIVETITPALIGVSISTYSKILCTYTNIFDN